MKVIMVTTISIMEGYRPVADSKFLTKLKVFLTENMKFSTVKIWHKMSRKNPKMQSPSARTCLVAVTKFQAKLTDLSGNCCADSVETNFTVSNPLLNDVDQLFSAKFTIYVLFLFVNIV